MDILADILGEENQPASARSNGNQDDDDDDLYDSSLMMNEEAHEENDYVEEDKEEAETKGENPENEVEETGTLSPSNTREEDSSNTRYFTVKASTHDEVAQSYESNTWNLSATAKHKVAAALNENFAVVLIITISGSRNFQGYMKIVTSSLEVDDSSASQTIDIRWRKLCHLSYNSTTAIKNALNDNQSVKLCRDGQELDRASAQQLIDLMHSLPDETLTSQKEKLTQGIILTPGAEPSAEPRISEEATHEPEEKRPRKDSGDKLWYERVKPNANIQHLLQEHSYLNEMDVTNMSYDEYLERFRMMQARAQEQFQMSFMPPPGYFPPMMPPMGMPPPMFQPGFGGFPRGAPRGKF